MTDEGQFFTKKSTTRLLCRSLLEFFVLQKTIHWKKSNPPSADMRNNMFTYLIYINFSPIPIALKPDQFFFQMISVEQQKLDQTTAEWPSN